jgi:drug/metabolite transporter (DMT)-like permease
MLAWVYWRTRNAPRRSAPWGAAAGAAAAGALCYYGGTTLDFVALLHLDVSVERVLLFSYPSMVVILHSIVFRRLPQMSVILALAVTYTGILLVVSGFDFTLLARNLGGSALVLACALTMALYYLASERWAGVLGSDRFTAIALSAATVCLCAQYLAHRGLEIPEWHARDSGLMAGLVVVATVVPMLALAESVHRLGAQRAAVVSTVGPPVTLLLGAWLLDERLGTFQWFGVSLIFAGILILEGARHLSRRADTARQSAKG